ncbi:MAG TPA: tetratricopeptide repeat protein [Chiayiivirga sp.]|nr:tetratricopeptide repeat protein [Chiayiivirga sp.]
MTDIHRTPNLLLFVLVLLVAAGCAGTPERTGAPQQQASERMLPEDDDPLFNAVAGEFALQQGDLDQAAQYLTRAAELQDDVEMAERATRVAIAAGTWVTARRALARWTALDPDALAAQQASATLALRDNDLDSARRSLARMLGDPREHGWMLASQVLGHAVDPDRAAQVLAELVAAGHLPHRADTLVVFSQLALRLDRQDLAVELADRALESFRDDGEVWLWSAQLRWQLDERDAAADFFRRGLNELPDNPQLRLGYASLLSDVESPAAAARFLAEGPQDDRVRHSRAAFAARAEDDELLSQVYADIQAAEQDPSPAGLVLLGQMAELLERYQDALGAYARVPEHSPEHAQARLRSAIVLSRMERLDEALELLRDIQIDTEDTEEMVDAVLLEADFLDKAGRPEEALAAFNRGLGLSPDDRRLVYSRALQYERMDRVEEALADFRRMLEADPDDPTALNALGYTLADRTEHYEEAYELIRRALEQVPSEPAYIDSMGWVKYRLGRFDEALEYLRRAFDLLPDAEVAAHLGEVLWVTGQHDEAREIWDRGHEIDADNRTLRSTLERFQP